MEVRIPAGVETGSRLRIAGEGEAGAQGGLAGDLYVVIAVREHERFERQGSNLYATVPISFAQAALGAEVTVETLDENQQLRVPAGTQTGTIFRLKNQGLPVLGGAVVATFSLPQMLSHRRRLHASKGVCLSN